MLFLLSLLLFSDTSDLILGAPFEDLETVSENFMNDPYSMQFADNGHLYVLDRIFCKVHQWDAQRKYVRSFGEKGQGPGEFTMPVKIVVVGETIWVWEFNRTFSSFDLSGKFKRSFKAPAVEARKFVALSPNQFLLSHRTRPGANERIQVFQLMDDEGKLGKKLAEITNHAKLVPGKNPYTGTFKAYAPEGDIQKATDGTFYYGYSQNKELVQVNARGEELRRMRFEHRDVKPTDSEREVHQALSFPNRRDGGRIKVSDFPGLKFDYTHPKSYYTQFMISGDKVVFVLTPIGDLDGAGNGFNRGSYEVFEMANGKRLDRGSFSFPIDSTLLMRDGRALAIIAAEEGFKMHEVSFRGL